MRTTLDIDDDILAAVHETAAIECTSPGQVVSRLLRLALMAGPVDAGSVATGFRAFASRGVEVTLSEVERLRDEEGV